MKNLLVLVGQAVRFVVFLISGTVLTVFVSVLLVWCMSLLRGACCGF